MSSFQETFRVPSVRAQWWNYANDGAYFITICTAQKECVFGTINQHKMHLSTIGDFVQTEWMQSFIIRKELFCDAFVIMPNHLHAIVRIENINESSQIDDQGQVYNHGVAFRAPRSISSFLAQFKAAVSKHNNQLNGQKTPSVWQTRFHDHIIRTDKEYQVIFNYILSNVSNWKQDRHYK